MFGVVDHLLSTWRMVTYDNDSPNDAPLPLKPYSASSRGTQQIWLTKGNIIHIACFGWWYFFYAIEYSKYSSTIDRFTKKGGS